MDEGVGAAAFGLDEAVALSTLKNFTVPMVISIFLGGRQSAAGVLGEAKEGKRSRKAPKTVSLRLVAWGVCRPLRRKL